mmetsp:Transcript_20951/g.41755  ORF Transcript_20951/g.41755 Transcript_20951/m.41755 type:complete len:239 (+) Transcript_20951:2509-3225(+)
MIRLDKRHRSLDSKFHKHRLSRMNDTPLEHTPFNLCNTTANTIPIIHQQDTTRIRVTIPMLQHKRHLLQHELETNPQISRQVDKLDILKPHLLARLDDLTRIQPIIDTIPLRKLCKLLDCKIGVITAHKITKYESSTRLGNTICLSIHLFLGQGMDKSILTKCQIILILFKWNLFKRCFHDIDTIRHIHFSCGINGHVILFLAQIETCGLGDGRRVFLDKVNGGGTGTGAKINVVHII